jgi:4-amino-4-deoxy-L-arabinose transferase-like glycosyltransferase
MGQFMRLFHSPSRAGWAVFILVLATAVFLRFYQLGTYPPGLYHDEAYNGLDALAVLDGQHALFFTNNNGREPAYIYLTAAAIALVGRSVLAVRLAAAVVGSLTVIPVYLLGQAWFGRRAGLLAAWLWAVTLWSVHLSRIGLRALLLPALLALTFWLGTLAYRRGRPALWLAAGLVYGATFYTYLAARFTPLLLAVLLLYLLWQGRGRRLWPGVAWFAAGTAVALFPFALLLLQSPDLILGRSGQVSILNPAINGGDLWGTLARQIGRSLGLFLWQGDMILRHNPAGRPLFDIFLAIPFLIGLVWCVRHWRRPAAMTVLLWTGIMLGPTILAEDAPHFLRAVGILPAALLLPAVGLDWLWVFQRKDAEDAKVSGESYHSPRLNLWRGVVIVLLAGSFALTLRDYAAYNRQPEVVYLFEAAVVGMADRINNEGGETAVFLDEERYWQKNPALRFLIPEERVQPFRPEAGLPTLSPPSAVYAWPYDGLTAVRAAISPPALVTVDWGGLARGDLERDAYPLYLRYGLEPRPDWSPLAQFGGALTLYQVDVTPLDGGDLLVEAYWEGETAVSPDWIPFVHVVGADGLLAQSDSPPAAADWPGTAVWPADWWQPGLLLRDRRILAAPPGGFPADAQLHLGWYDRATGSRLPVSGGGEVFVWP